MRRCHSLVFSLLLLLPASATPAATNLCLNKPASASGYDSTSYQPSYSVDGKTTTYWQQIAPGEKWVEVDLGSTKTIQRWVVKNACTANLHEEDCINYTTWGYALQASTDNLYWNYVDWIEGDWKPITDRDINPTTARYFAIDVPDAWGADDGNPANGDNAARVIEFELYEQPLNLARGKAAKADSNVTGQTPSLAVDGSVSTLVDNNWDAVPDSKWCSMATGNKWLQVDLGSAKSVLKWVVHHAGAGGEDPRYNTLNFQLQGSADAKTWTTLDTVANNRSNTTNRNLPAAKSYRYFRLWITEPSVYPSDHGARIYEFQLYGPEVLPTPAATFKEDKDCFPWGHAKTLKLVKYDSEAAIYFDQDPPDPDPNSPDHAFSPVDPKYANWTHQWMKTLWTDIRNNWGSFGLTNRIMLRAHQLAPNAGGEFHHQFYYRYNEFENGVDGSWDGAWDDTYKPSLLKRCLIHEMGHIVEGAVNNTFSPGGASQVANLWGDDAFNALLVWDVIKRVGTAQEIADAHAEALNSDGSDLEGCAAGGGCPPGTTPSQVAWFGKFFEPIYNGYGGIGFMVRYYQLARRYYQLNERGYYDHRMNVGEFIHFMSAAAGVSEKAQAKMAWGTWLSDWDTQYQQARVTYSVLNSYYK
jgi:hypothetical protein